MWSMQYRNSMTMTQYKLQATNYKLQDTNYKLQYTHNTLQDTNFNTYTITKHVVWLMQ